MKHTMIDRLFAMTFGKILNIHKIMKKKHHKEISFVLKLLIMVQNTVFNLIYSHYGSKTRKNAIFSSSWLFDVELGCI